MTITSHFLQQKNILHSCFRLKRKILLFPDMWVKGKVFTQAVVNFLKIFLVEYLKWSLHLNNDSNNTFLCSKTKRSIFYCSKRKKSQFIWINKGMLMIFLYFLKHMNPPTRFANICLLNTRTQTSLLNRKILSSLLFLDIKICHNGKFITTENQHLVEFSPIMKVSFHCTKREDFYTHITS